MRLKSMHKKFLFSTSLILLALSSKNFLIYNEELIVAACFIAFIILIGQSFGKTLKETINARIQAIQDELQQFLNPNEVLLTESNEQQRLLRISLQICGRILESLPMARSHTSRAEWIVLRMFSQNLNAKLAILKNASFSRQIHLQDDLVTAFQYAVSERFLPGAMSKTSIVELIREGLKVLKKGRSTKENEQKKKTKAITSSKKSNKAKSNQHRSNKD